MGVQDLRLLVQHGEPQSNSAGLPPPLHSLALASRETAIRDTCEAGCRIARGEDAEPRSTWRSILWR